MSVKPRVVSTKSADRFQDDIACILQVRSSDRMQVMMQKYHSLQFQTVEVGTQRKKTVKENFFLPLST